jgi:ribosomal protein S27AE
MGVEQDRLMKLRWKRTLAIPDDRRTIARRFEVCPYCGHTARLGQGRIVDHHTERAVCVRCGSEIRSPQ